MILSVFPGLGKTYASTHFVDEFSMIDSDSSQFHYLEGLGGTTLDPTWPERYLDHIEENVLLGVDFIFVSTHEEVRRGLASRNIQYVLVIPHRTMKDEFIRRYQERGSSPRFVELLSSRWDDWTSYAPERETPSSRIFFNDGYLDREFLRRLKT
jgi:hypothetical protein